MTTTFPDLAADTGAAPRDDVARVRREAARLTAMPRTWEPTIAELLDDEARRTTHHTPGPQHSDIVDAPAIPPAPPVATPRVDDGAPTGHAPRLADLDAALDGIVEIEQQVAHLHARRAELVARVCVLAEALESDLVDDTDPVARTAPSSRRLELARRAVVAELATTLRVGEHAAGTLADHALTLTAKAPATLSALARGALSWAHATQITKHLANLTGDEAAHVEAAVLATAVAAGVVCTPGQLGRQARRAREMAHPVPAEVRRAEAATHRAVWLDDGRDGMAWLTAHLPAPLAHAAYDRLTRTARHLTSTTTSRHGTRAHPAETRTPSQARADVLAALLLDDGTLDLTAADSLHHTGDVTATDFIHHREDTAPAPEAGTGDDPADGHHDLSHSLETTRHDPVPDLLYQQSALATLARSIRPQVTVTVPVLTLLGHTDAPATMNGHIPIDPDTARQLAALAPSFRRLLTHPETGTVLSVGRTTYTVPADLKALVTARDTTCRFPGCTRPAATSDLDHTTAWAHGGTTATTNLAALCRHHHLLKHQSTWQVRQVPSDGAPQGGKLEWTSPTGRTYRTEPTRPETTRHRTMPHGHEPESGQGPPSPGSPGESPPPY